MAATKTDRMLVNGLLEPELYNALEDFRYANRFPTRSGAMKYLLATRLAQQPEPTPEEVEQYSAKAS